MYQTLLFIQYASIVLMLFMCAYITKKWNRPLHGWLFFYCVATLINNAGYLGIMLSKTEEATVISWKFSYMGRVWIPFSLLQFVIWLCNKKRYPIVSDILALIHAITFFLVLGMEHNTLYYKTYAFSEEGLFPHLVHTNGIWHYLHDVLIVSYILYGLTSLIILLRTQSNPRRRKQLIFIMAAILTDIAFFLLEILKVAPGYDVTTLGYTLATLFLYLAIFRYDILGTKELARDFVIDNVSDGVIVTDEEGSVVDYNRRALSIIPMLESDPHEALSMIQTVIAENRAIDYDGKKYTPKENSLMDEKHTAGKVYLLSDDTEHYRRAEQLTREMMLALSNTVDAKDHYTNGHSQRVAKYSMEIARRMGKSPEDQEKIYEMGLLHDIGKIGVSEEILNKTSRLTDEEFSQIKQHTVIGSNILSKITVMPELDDGARSHHERYDGRGYPDGLKGEEIPEAARIICLADCYDAMTSTRTYSKPKPQEAVRAEIERCKGSQFDPEIADIMISMIDDDKEYTMHE